MDNLMKFIEKLNEQLLSQSFFEGRTANGEKVPGVYLRIENPVLYIIGVFEKNNQEEVIDILSTYTKEMSQDLEEMRCTHIISLGIYVSEEEGDFPAPVYFDERIHAVNWRYSIEKKKVFANAGEPDRLFGIEKLLLRAAEGKVPEAPPKPEMKSGLPWVCISIFLLCAVLLIDTTLSGRGGSIIRAYGLSRSGILQGEYYRLITSMFLHSGIMHLLSNSLFLYYFGFKAEYLLGRKRFFILYLVSGLCGGLFSILFHDVLAIGASGAIYGLMGAMFVLTKLYGSRYTGMNYATMLLLVVTSIGFGFLDMGIDNFAHIGGFIGGSLVFLIYRKLDRKQREIST